MSIADRLRELGIDLPDAPAPVGAYVAWIRTGNLIITSGQLPWQDGEILHAGRLGAEVTDEQGYEAARLAAINAIAQLRDAVDGDLDQVKRIVRLEGYVHCVAGYRGHPQALNGASDLLVEVFGEKGKHTRTALGIADMPLNAPLQLVLWAEV